MKVYENSYNNGIIPKKQNHLEVILHLEIFVAVLAYILTGRCRRMLSRSMPVLTQALFLRI